ncbi:MAG: bifunctional diguanylate cyclase/phosphodiesterase [Thermoanaerobaculia bacterium]
MQKPKSQADTQPFKSREGRRASSGVTGRPATLLIDSPDATVLFDVEGRVLFANITALAEGVPSPGSIEGPPDSAGPFWSNPEGRTRFLAAGAAGGLRNWENRLPAGVDIAERLYWISTCFAPQAGEGGFVASAREVTGAVTGSRGDAEPAAEPADALTGFANREQFHFELEREIARADLFARPLALIILGLDNFKTLNDTHGLLAGDQYLRSMADTLRASLQPGETCGRVGGDEVAILLPGTGATEATARAETIVSLIKKLAPDWEGNALSLTASAGVTVFPEHAGGAADLFLAADLAMHQAKRRGGARVRLHDPSDRERDRTGRLREQSNRIRAALAESRFIPYFQPVAEVGTGRVVAVETLARMREPDGRIALPGEFLGAAERFGIVTAIDRAIIAGAFDALAAARKKISPELEMGINLSGIDFDDDALVADISRLARAKGIRPERITFEITETAAVRDFDRVLDFTRALTSEGFRFALDDFGMGFSSFRYLRELPVSSLKLDISYVRDLPKQKANRVFVRGMAGICRGLGVKTVAEGVESEDVWEILPELGVDRAQGWHLGFPEATLPVVDVDASQPLPRRYRP